MYTGFILNYLLPTLAGNVFSSRLMYAIPKRSPCTNKYATPSDIQPASQNSPMSNPCPCYPMPCRMCSPICITNIYDRLSSLKCSSTKKIVLSSTSSLLSYHLLVAVDIGRQAPGICAWLSTPPTSNFPYLIATGLLGKLHLVISIAAFAKVLTLGDVASKWSTPGVTGWPS